MKNQELYQKHNALKPQILTHESFGTPTKFIS